MNTPSKVATALRDIAVKYNLPQCIDLADALDKDVDMARARAVDESSVVANLAMARAEEERAAAERARAAAITANSNGEKLIPAQRLESLAQNERQCRALESIAISLSKISGRQPGDR